MRRSRLFLIQLFFQSATIAVSAQNIIDLVVPNSHNGGVVSWDVSQSGEYGLSTGDDNTVILWEISTGSFIKSFNNDSTINSAYFLSDNNRIVILGDNKLIIMDINNGKFLQDLKGKFTSILVCGKRNEFVLIDKENRIFIYKLNNGQYEKANVIKANSQVAAISYSENGNDLLYYDTKIRVFDVSKNKSSEFDFPQAGRQQVRSLALNNNKTTFAIGTVTGVIYLYNGTMQNQLDSLAGYTSPYWAGTPQGFLKDSLRLDIPVTDLAFDDGHLQSFYFGISVWGNSHSPKFHYINWRLSDRKPFIHKSDLPGCVYEYSESPNFARGFLFCDYTIFDFLHDREFQLKTLRTQIKTAKFADGGKKILFSTSWAKGESDWVWDLTEGTKYPMEGSLATPKFNSNSKFIAMYGNFTKYDSVPAATRLDSAWIELDRELGRKSSYFMKRQRYALGIFNLTERKISKYVKEKNNLLDNIRNGELTFNPARPHLVISDNVTSTVVDFEQDRILAKLNEPSVSFSENGNLLIGRKYIYDGSQYTIVDTLDYTQNRLDNGSGPWSVRHYNYKGYWSTLNDGVFITKWNKYFSRASYGRIYVRDYKRNLVTDTLIFRMSQLTVMKGSPDENYLAVGFQDGSIQLIATEKLNVLKSLKAHAGPVVSIDFTPDNRFMLSASEDGSIKVFDLQSYKEVAKIIFYGDDWVVVTPEYLFDGSTGGLENLFFINGLRTIELKQMKDRFYEPGLLQKVFGYSKEPLRDSHGLNNIKPYPKIEIDDPAKNDKGLLTIRLTNEGGGIGKTKILINGKEATTDARGDGFNPDTESTTVVFKLANHPYLKHNELNQIEVQASNKEGYLTSKPKKVHYFAEGNVQTDTRLHAVIIGTSDYNGAELDLRFASKDAEQFAQALENAGKKLFGVNSVNIQLLTTNKKDSWPTKENIQQAFKTISTTASPNDLLVVYLAGHGTNFGGAEGDFYYLTASAKNGNLSDPGIRQQVAISSSEFTEYIKWVPSLKQIMILDACHSGKFAEDLLAKREAKSSSEIRALERMKDRTGLYILAGSASDAVSYEASIYGQGLLTYSLLFGMKGAALRDNQFVDVMELFQYCADEVPRMAANIGGIQKPELRVPFGGESFDIGIVDDVIRQEIILPTPKPVFLRSVFQDEETFGDPLGLSEHLDQQLKILEINSAKIIFIDAMKFSDAYTLRGRYKKTGASYEVSCKLLKGDKLSKDISITGEDLETIGKKIMEQSVSIMK